MPFPLDWEHVAALLLLDVDCFALPYSHLLFMHLEGGSGGGGDCGDIIGVGGSGEDEEPRQCWWLVLLGHKRDCMT